MRTGEWLGKPWGNLTYCRGVTCHGLVSRPGEVEILLAASCYRNRDKLGSYEPVGPKTSVFLPLKGQNKNDDFLKLHSSFKSRLPLVADTCFVHTLSTSALE